MNFKWNIIQRDAKRPGIYRKSGTNVGFMSGNFGKSYKLWIFLD